MSVSGTSHNKCPGKSMGTEQAPGNLPARHTLPPVSHHLQLRAIASSGLPRKDKAEIASPTGVVLWPVPHLCYIRRTSHCVPKDPICRILAGEALGLALVLSQHKSHPDCKRHPQKGLKVFAITKTQQKLSSKEYKIFTENILKAVKSWHLPLLTTVFQASTATSHSTEQTPFSMWETYCSALLERL